MDTYFNLESVVNILGENTKKLSGKTILWTGTGGYLGQWVIRVIKYLNSNVLDVPCKLLAVDMNYPGKDYIEYFSSSNIEFVKHDLTKRLHHPKEKIDYVVHMAGIASPYHYKRRPLDTIDVTLEGIRSALDIAKDNKAKFLFTSSSEVYQTPDVIPTPETYIGAIPSNTERSCYDVSKLMGENLVYIYSNNYGVDGCSVRIFNSFGPGISEYDARILPRIASSVISNIPIKVYRKKELPTRTYCAAANTVAGVFLALLNGRPSEVYNIGADNPEISVVDLIELINSTCGVKVNFELIEPPSVYIHEPLRRCPDISKAKSDLGYKIGLSLNDGLQDYISWASKNYSGIQQDIS